MKFSVALLATLAVGLATASANAVSNTILSKLPGVVRADSDCATFCRFRLCVLGSDGEFIPLPTGFGLTFPPAYRAEPPFICSEFGPRIGRILRIREARVRLKNGGFVGISKFRRMHLKRRFPPDFYTTRDFTVPELIGLSAITRSKFRYPDQREALDGQCVFLPITKWETMRRSGTVGRIVSSTQRRSCVSFIATSETTQIKITFMWNTAADLDIRVFEPDDSEVSFAVVGRKSPNGGFLLEDTTLGDCSANSGLRESVEMIEYSGLSTPPEGTYTISLAQFASCGDLETDWSLSITIGDNTILEKSGTVLSDFEGVFKTLDFTFPDGEVIHETAEPTYENSLDP